MEVTSGSTARRAQQAFNKPEHKKYRLRPINFSNENNIYKKYFQVSPAKWMSWTLIILGIATVAAKFMQLLLTKNLTWATTLNNLGGWGLVTLASVVTLAGAYRSSYCRLHSAMALHILNVVVQYIIVEKLFTIEIPKINHGLEAEVREADIIDSETAAILCKTMGRNCTSTVLEQMEKRELNNIYGYYRVELILAGMLSIYGIFQLLLSFVLALMTGRAICCGRMSLERKFYEIESMGSPEQNSAKIQRPMTPVTKESADPSTMIFKRKESEHSDTSLGSLCHSPLPYGVTASPRSSEDAVDGGAVVQKPEKIVLQAPPAYSIV